jgi:hypothetical protein
MRTQDVEQLSHRLDRLGMRLEGDRLTRAAAIVRAHGADAAEISDMALLSICVEAYRHPEKETLQVV